jgi:hypothetical protein
MAIPKRTTSTPNKTPSPSGFQDPQAFSHYLPYKHGAPGVLVPPGTPGPNPGDSSGESNTSQDPDVIQAQKKIDDLKIEETKACIQLLQADTEWDMWFEVEQNNREILRSSKQLHYDAHQDHISTEYEAAQDQDLAIRRGLASEQRLIAQNEYEQARAHLRNIRELLHEARQEHTRLIKYKLTGQWQQDINNYLNPFVRFGPWGQKYGWYLLAFLLFAALVIWLIH